MAVAVDSLFKGIKMEGRKKKSEEMPDRKVKEAGNNGQDQWSVIQNFFFIFVFRISLVFVGFSFIFLVQTSLYVKFAIKTTIWLYTKYCGIYSAGITQFCRLKGNLFL